MRRAGSGGRRIKVAYADTFQWHGTSYFGAFVRPFEQHDLDGPFDDAPRDWP